MAIWRGAGGPGDATTDAANEASVASTKAAEAEASATAAAGSATSAANSATNAASSATAAAGSASSASSSATSATNSATNASTSETNAASSETAAAASESASLTSQIAAENAQNYAEEWATKIEDSLISTAAGGDGSTDYSALHHASKASASASAAASSASAASSSETAAANSATSAAASYDSFDDRYLGAKATDPSTDNDGDALITGALYFNTTSNDMKVWSGSAWEVSYATLSGALVAANNLSDLTDATTARTNLGVAIGSDVQAYDADTAKYDDVTANFTGTLQNGGSNVVVDSDIGSTVQAYDATIVVDADIGSTVQAYSSVLQNTTASYTTAEETKLAGIETLADVTDTTNVTAAGALMDSELTSEASVKALNQGVATTDSPSFAGLTVDTNTLYVDATNNRVGIGTSSPQSRLESTGSIRSTGATDPTSGSSLELSWRGTYADVLSYDRTAGAFEDLQLRGSPIIFGNSGGERMRIDSSGNVGIGTSGPSAKLDVVTTTAAPTSAIWTGANLTLKDNSTYAAGVGGGMIFEGKYNTAGTYSVFGYIRGSKTDASDGGYQGGIVYGTRSGDHVFVTNGSGLTDGTTERMRITSTGNVGIGTTSPNKSSSSTALTVDAPAVANYAALELSSGETLNWYINANNTAVYDNTAGTRSRIFYTNGSERMRITSSGNVGIGTTAPASNLQVVGAVQDQIRFGTSTSVYTDLWMGTGYTVFDSIGGSSGGFDFRDDGTSRMHINSSGNVGIGTSSPATLLHIQSTDPSLRIKRSDAGTDAYGDITTDTSGFLTIKSDPANAAAGSGFRVTIDNTERMRIDSSGNVGIGTSSPTATLDVNGTIKLDGNYPIATGNVALGSRALDALTTGNYNVGIGYDALTNNTEGFGNTAVGRLALGANTTANSNTAVGYLSLYTNTTGAQNTAIGRDSLRSNTTGNYNTAVGMNALYNNTTAVENTALGYDSLSNATTGGGNTGIGKGTLGSTTTGTSNIAVGSARAGFHGGAGQLNTTGYNNTCIGAGANFSNSTGTNNVAVGHLALYGSGSAEVKSENTAVGSQSARNTTTGTANVAVGLQSLYSNTTGAQNVAVGYQTLYYNTASNNVAVGYHALQDNTTATEMTAVGTNALANNTINGASTAVGTNALVTNTTGNDHVAVGAACLNNNTTGYYNTAVGRSALYANTTGYQNVAIGRTALSSCTTSPTNVAVGNEALTNLTTGGGENVAVGNRAGVGVTTGAQNIIIGDNAAANSASGGWNACTIVGDNAGLTNTASYNILIGAGSNNSAASNASAIVIGVNTTGKGGSTGYINPNGGAMYQGNNTTTWNTISDRRIKKNIVDNTEGLEKINAIQVKNFEYRLPEEVDPELSPSDAINKTGVQLGVIAQELQEVCPDCVKQESTGVLSVDSDNLFWHMINAVKELSAKCDALQSEINILKGN